MRREILKGYLPGTNAVLFAFASASARIVLIMPMVLTGLWSGHFGLLLWRTRLPSDSGMSLQHLWDLASSSPTDDQQGRVVLGSLDL
jgi:hypothetical protein